MCRYQVVLPRTCTRCSRCVQLRPRRQLQHTWQGRLWLRRRRHPRLRSPRRAQRIWGLNTRARQMRTWAPAQAVALYHRRPLRSSSSAGLAEKTGVGAPCLLRPQQREVARWGLVCAKMSCIPKPAAAPLFRCNCIAPSLCAQTPRRSCWVHCTLRSLLTPSTTTAAVFAPCQPRQRTETRVRTSACSGGGVAESRSHQRAD